MVGRRDQVFDVFEDEPFLLGHQFDVNFVDGHFFRQIAANAVGVFHMMR